MLNHFLSLPTASACDHAGHGTRTVVPFREAIKWFAVMESLPRYAALRGKPLLPGRYG
jgi:hypothetical protein